MAKYELVWKNCVVSDGDYIVSFVIDVWMLFVSELKFFSDHVIL